MSLSLNIHEQSLFKKPLRGKVEFYDDKGNFLFQKDNLILTSTRFAVLYNLFNDDKILHTAYNNDILIPPSEEKKNLGYRPAICGFTFGCNGANVSNPSILRVPSPSDKIDDISAQNSTNFIPIPFITIDNSLNVLDTGGSFNNLEEYINYPVYSETDGIISEGTSSNTISAVKYFTVKSITDNDTDISGNFYCKAINVSNSSINMDPDSYEIRYTIKFKVEAYDLIGKTFNELGLVLANCLFSDSGNIIDVDTNTVVLGSRVTFDEMSLSKELLASFNIKYHIYI